MKLLLISILILCLGCSCIPYKSDAGLVSSAKANVDMFPVKINGKFCKTNNDITGTCAFAVNRDVKTTISLIPLPYNYDVTFDCTDALNYDIKENVPKETARIFEIEDYSGIVKTFYCKCAIYPNGKKPASVSFRFLIVVNNEYVHLPKPNIGKKKVILGQYAYKSVCCKGNDCKFFTKKTEIKNRGYDFCYVESEAGRASSVKIN